jgi:hypothetical protein
MPTRVEVDDLWAAVAAGRLSREEAHGWAERLMFAEVPSEDEMVMSALQSIHGLDMTYRSDDQRLVGHGPPGSYLRSLDEVQAALLHWRARCVERDEDPDGFRERNLARARQYIQAEGLRPKDPEQQERWTRDGIW